MKKAIHSVLVATLLAASLAASAAPGEQAHHAKGTVKKIDAAKGTVTIAHDPVPSIKWPAMVMPFRAPKVMLETLKPGQMVDFEFVAKGMDATITKLGATQ